jgi:hypothetical protein
MDAAAIISAIQAELQKHTWDTFVNHPPSIAKGGNGVVVPGCPACRKVINTIGQFMDHISYDVLPLAIEGALYGREPGEEDSDNGAARRDSVK